MAVFAVLRSTVLFFFFLFSSFKTLCTEKTHIISCFVVVVVVFFLARRQNECVGALKSAGNYQLKTMKTIQVNKGLYSPERSVADC